MICIKLLKTVLIIMILAIALTLVASFLSRMEFNTANPFSCGVGLAKILFTDTDYVEIQQSPRVILAQPENSRDLMLNVMQNEGYTFLEDETMGSMHAFEKDGIRERLFFSVNKYFSKWIWER